MTCRTITHLCLITLIATGCAQIQDRVFSDKIYYLDDTSLETIKEQKAQTLRTRKALTHDTSVTAFREIDAFKDDAKCWSTSFSMFAGMGFAIFDANNDGRLDIYFCQNGQNWVRPTDENSVLKDHVDHLGNSLYLNQGNDANNNPVFKPANELARANNTFVEEELLIEGFLTPRTQATDSMRREGRASVTAIAADFNGDGRIDLLVGNFPSGMSMSDPQTRNVLPAFVDPIGRSVKRSKLPITPLGMYLINYHPENSFDKKRNSSRGQEFEGANSLYLNMGDRDNDGLPEWKDASRSAGIEGFRPTTSFSVADFDGDGDLDVFEANVMDPDYWISGSTKMAGAANCLYLNQLVETGELRFIEKASEYNCDGVFDDDNPMPYYYRLRRIKWLPAVFSFLSMKWEPYQPDYLSINGEQCEKGQISWASLAQDVNDDGYPDLWVANDMGYMRLYENLQGKGFKERRHARTEQGGFWMSFAPADFNRDLKEDFFAGSVGGAIYNNSAINVSPHDLFDPDMLTCTIAAQMFQGSFNSTHSFFDGRDQYMSEMDSTVVHSTVLPPDIMLPNNQKRALQTDGPIKALLKEDAVDSYEFAWGSTALDVQNDGLTDLYWVGGLNGRPGSFVAMMGVNPGRLLVNVTPDGSDLRFIDQTAEHRVFNIHELRYDKLSSHGYLYRRSPRQNWSKREMVYSYDRSSMAINGPVIQKRASYQDLIQTAEYGMSTLAADFNGDGFSDILIRNRGGYDSRRPNSQNLKIKINGTAKVVPAHTNIYPTLTNYEPGASRLFVNSYSGNNWIKIRLIDDTKGQYNPNAIGAKVQVNQRFLAVKRAGAGSYAANANTDIHIGLGKEKAQQLTVTWPGPKLESKTYTLNQLSNQTITISRVKGVIQ